VGGLDTSLNGRDMPMDLKLSWEKAGLGLYSDLPP